MAGLNPKIDDIKEKIDNFYNETRNTEVLNNIWITSRFDTNAAVGGDNKYANFFKVINTIDSIKDGTQKDLATNVFMGSLLQDNESTNLPSPDSFKQAIKALFRTKIETNYIRKIPYSRIKGDRNEKQVICDRSFYDCNLKPNKIARKADYTDPDEKITIGNKIDTGPSNTESMRINCKTMNDYLNKTHMKILGYTNTELSFNNQNGKCDNLVLFDKRYSDPEKALKQLAVGNNKKAVILNSKTRLTLKDKAGYIYYKSLGDKLIAYCYYLDCEPPPQDQESSKCLFTCDIFVALLAYIFGESFVYNENDSMPKVTNVFYRNIAGGQVINYNGLCQAEKTKILAEYNSEIGRIQTIINDKNNFMFTGDTNTYRNTGSSVGDTTNLLMGNFLAIMRAKLQTLRDSLNRVVGTNLGDYTNIKRYKLMKLLKPNTNNEFIRTRYQVCINDTTGFTNNNKKYTIYDLYQILLKQQPQNGGVKLTDAGDNQIYDSLYKVEPKIGFNDMTLENNLLKYVMDTYNTQKKEYTERIPACFACADKIDEFFNNKYIWVNKDNEFNETEQGQPYVTSMISLGKHGYFDYGHIYDVLTYYFYADANYEDNYIIEIIRGIFNGIINDAELPKTYTPDPEIQDVSTIRVTNSEGVLDVNMSQCAPNNYDCINNIRNKWLKIRGNQKVPTGFTSEGATLEVTSSDDDEDVELTDIQSGIIPENENISNSRESTSSGTSLNGRTLSPSSYLRGDNIDTENTFESISQSPINFSTLRQRSISGSPTRIYGGARKTKKRKIKRRKTLKKNKKQKRKRKTIKK